MLLQHLLLPIIFPRALNHPSLLSDILSDVLPCEWYFDRISTRLTKSRVLAYTASSKHIYDKFIMVEPAMMSPELEDKYPSFYPALIKGVRTRQRNWKSSDEANDYISTRKPWRDWDAGVRTEFVVSISPGAYTCNEAITEERTPTPCKRKTWCRISLYCPSRGGSVWSFRRSGKSGADFSTLSNNACTCYFWGRRRSSPVSCVYVFESIHLSHSGHREVQDNIIDGNQGRRMASVTHISEAGHFVRIWLLQGVIDSKSSHILGTLPASTGMCWSNICSSSEHRGG